MAETKSIFKGGALSSSISQDQLPTMHFVQRSAHLVNVGAHYLSIGDDYSAYGALKRGLDVLQQVAATDVDFDALSEQRNIDTDDQDSILPLVAIPFDCERNEMTLFGTADDEDKSFYFVHSKPFVFDQSSLDVANTPIYISIAIFNMTLLLLRKARTESDCNESVRKSLRLFDMALILVKSSPSHVDSSNLLVALLNNKAHVCYCMHQFDDAHASLKELSGLLATACMEDSAFDETEVNGMVLNTLLANDPTRLARAA